MDKFLCVLGIFDSDTSLCEKFPRTRYIKRA